MSEVIIRSFKPIQDIPFIISSFRKNSFFSGINVTCTWNEWYDEFKSYWDEILPVSNILIACLIDDPEQLLGYSIILNQTIQFFFVKPGYRKSDIAKLLLSHYRDLNPPYQINDKFLTKNGLKIIKAHPNLFKQSSSCSKENT